MGKVHPMLHPYRNVRRVLLALVVALGLVAPVALTTSAVADDLPPTTVRVYVSGGDHVGTTYYVTVIVDGPTGDNVPSADLAVTGVGDGSTVHAPNGYVQLTGVATSNDPITVTATVVAAPGFATGGTGSATTVPLQHPTFSAEPTVAKVNPGLKLTLTLSTRATNFLGQPMAGVRVVFTLFDAYEQGAPGIQQPVKWVKVCEAYTDANGLATCGGAGALASVVSILSGGAYATWSINPWGNFTKLPVVVSG